MAHDAKKCAHAPCTCQVTEGTYCSQSCEDTAAAAPGTLGCDCPHSSCGGKL